ncbi:hypothetical protein BDW69DRAFT_168341 [Aspergillus filifer]
MTATSDSRSEPTNHPNTTTDIAITMGPRTLPALFSSLSRPSTSGAPKRWTLLRKLKSENVHDLTGDLHGTATFTPLPPKSARAQDQAQGHQDLLYSEEGSLPASFGPGLRWTKNYIWRLSPEGKISVWFVKVDKAYQDGEQEADYLFHEFNFDSAISTSDDLDTFDVSASVAAIEASGLDMEEFVVAPVPPPVSHRTAAGSEMRSKVISARGNHLCIDDMYRTAYAFRIDEESGEVLSWASRHVVKGPKKGQDIVNFYSRAD